MDDVNDIYEKTNEITKGAPRSQAGTSVCTSLHSALKSFCAHHRIGFGAGLDMAIYQLLIGAGHDFEAFNPTAQKDNKPQAAPYLKWQLCNECKQTFRQPLDVCPKCGSKNSMLI